MKNDGTYKLALHPGLGTAPNFIYPSTVYPFEYAGLELFAHKEYNGGNKWGTYWEATEKITGMSVSRRQSFKTKERAMADAEINLRNCNMDFIKNKIIKPLIEVNSLSQRAAA